MINTWFKKNCATLLHQQKYVIIIYLERPWKCTCAVQCIKITKWYYQEIFLEKFRSFRCFMPFHSATLPSWGIPKPWESENVSSVILGFAGFCGSFAESCGIFAGNFQRFRWQLSLCSTQPSDLEKHPGHPIAVPKTRSFRSFRCLTSKPIAFREKQVNTENLGIFPRFWISR